VLVCRSTFDLEKTRHARRPLLERGGSVLVQGRGSRFQNDDVSPFHELDLAARTDAQPVANGLRDRHLTFFRDPHPSLDVILERYYLCHDQEQVKNI
jgi:hypothetical protein